MAEQEKWHWQEPGTAWRGVGLYHITLTIPSRQPLLGRLIIPDGDASKAKVLRTALGNALVDSLLGIPRHHPEVQVLHFCLMPDHLHAVLYVRRLMSKGIGSVVRGLWQASKKLGRAWSEASFVAPNGIRGNCQEGVSQRRDIREVRSGSPSTGKNIGTALIKAEYAKVGTEIYIKIREKLLKAVTVKMPFYEG